MQRSWIAATLVSLTLACADEGEDDASEDTAPATGETERDPDPGSDEIPAEPLIADPLTACPGSYTTTAPQTGDNRDFVSAEQDRNFWLMLPEELGPGPHPLLVAFNGTGETGQLFSVRAALRDFTRHGFIVVAPSSNANGTVWPVWDGLRTEEQEDLPNADLTYFDDLVQCLAAHYPIDANRIYIGGHSAGGLMTHYVLQRRSEIIAGAIPASGVFSLTSPTAPTPIDDTFVIVTWGGQGDSWEGSADGGGVSVPPFDFVEQASLASQFYVDQPDVGQVHCSAEVGHAWLDEANDWMAEQLLAHPKGRPGTDGAAFMAPPPETGVSCGTDAYVYASGLTVTCVGGGSTGCQETCQALGDCVVENATVASVLEPQLPAFGFSGEGFTECGGCIEHCEQTLAGAADEAVMACMKQEDPAPRCGPGIEGALVLPETFNTCCAGQTESAWCADVCEILESNTAVASFFEACAAFEG